MRFTTKPLFAALTLCLSGAAVADYPERPITLVNPYAAGGPADTLGRALAERLAKVLDGTVVVENRPGGGASIGASYVSRAEPDGYTLLLGTAAAHVVTPLMTAVNYEGIDDFEFISIVGNQPNMLVVNPEVDVDSAMALVEMAKANPGSINYASAGPGTSPHLGGELFAQRAGIDITHIPYKGAAPAITDVVGGQVEMALLNLSASLPFIQDGRLKALAYAAEERSPLLPDVPTLAEVGIADAESASWYSLVAPAGTPQAVIERLNAAVNEVNQQEDYIADMQEKGVELWSMTPAEARTFVEADRGVVEPIVEAAGLKAE